jgi:hypothetical protein
MVVVLLENLRKLGEAALKWSFFTLNIFMISISLVTSE